MQQLSPRGRALLVGCLLSALLLIIGTAIPVPFVALGAGSTFNTLGSVDGRDVITFTGKDIPESVDEPTSGHLNMLTVRVIDKIPLVESVAMWVSGRYEFAPREEYYPPDKSKEQVTEENVAMFRDSQSAAEITALRYLGYPNIVYVGTIEASSPSWGLLEPQDQITAVNAHPVTDYPSLKAIMADTHPGESADVTVLRDGSPVTVAVTLGANADIGPQGVLGIGVAERPDAPFDITIALEDIGGPSAGLMFTLGIIDRLTPGELTGGQFIAGTGTIEMDGRVGPIGGVTFKESAARSAGATHMLVPRANCPEALTDVPDGLTLVAVDTIVDAMDSVRSIAAGDEAPPCELLAQ